MANDSRLYSNLFGFVECVGSIAEEEDIAKPTLNQKLKKIVSCKDLMLYTYKWYNQHKQYWKCIHNICFVLYYNYF